MTKYRNKKLTTPDGPFDSQREYKRWCELKLLEKAGVIQDLRRQVDYVLLPRRKRDDGTFERAVKYKADFVYLERWQEVAGDGTFIWSAVVEDSKGMKTDVWILKRKMMLHFHGISVRET